MTLGLISHTERQIIAQLISHAHQIFWLEKSLCDGAVAILLFELEFYGPVNTVKFMSSESVNLLTGLVL